MKLLKLTALFSLISSMAYANEIKIHGSTTFNAIIFEMYKGPLESSTGLKLDIIANGSANGVNDLISGKADIAMTSSSLDSLKAKLTGPTDNLQVKEIGVSSLIVIKHQSNKITSLTLEQLKSILTGKIKNWSEVGGENKPIAIITQNSSGGLRNKIEKEIVGAALQGDIKEPQNVTQIPQICAQLPSCIAIVPEKVVSPDITKISITNTKFEDHLSLITKDKPTADQQKLIDAIINLKAL